MMEDPNPDKLLQLPVKKQKPKVAKKQTKEYLVYHTRAEKGGASSKEKGVLQRESNKDEKVFEEL